MTYQQLLDYFDKKTNLEKMPKEKWEWDCFKDCGIPCYEKVHFMNYIHMKLKKEYEKASKSTDYKEEIPEVFKERKNKPCNACRFSPKYPDKFMEFMNRDDRTAIEINRLFGNVNNELTEWICKALCLCDELGLSSGKRFEEKTWKIDGINVKDKYFTDEFWESKLSTVKQNVVSC